MSNGNMIQQLRKMSEADTITNKQAIQFIMAGVADLLENQHIAKEERETTNQELIKMNSRIGNAEEDIGDLKKHSNKFDAIIGFLTLLGTVIGSIFGSQN